jgi:deazaflavin-dependent oxidoreductase (nitroreductase family)
MHLPRALARFNRHVTNPIQRRWAGVIGLHGIVEHTGRRSGRAYRTPVLVFDRPGGFAITIGYGLRSDWVRNLLAADGGALVHRRRRYVLTNPRVLTGAEALDALPAGYRAFARAAHVEGVLVVEAAVDAAGESAGESAGQA